MPFGLPTSELTLAELMKGSGYGTCCVGKWHLGHLPPCLPTYQGFESYYGIPYSNDMDRVGGPKGRAAFWDPKSEYWNVPLMRNEEVVERPADKGYDIAGHHEINVPLLRMAVLAAAEEKA